MSRVRVGIVGAGANTRLRHVPGFRQIDGVELAAVVNSTPESTARAADELQVPRQCESWQQLVEDPQIDAVMIGTWPNLHCEITCAALAAGKHVLTEARMARNLDEARRMLAAAQEYSDRVVQIVPSPFGLAHHQFIRQLIDDGFLGELRELVVIGADDTFFDASQPIHWRQDRSISGHNLLAMGILHETASRFVADPARVFAQARLCGTRPTPTDSGRSLDIPDSVQVVTRLADGAGGLYHLSGAIRHGPGRHIHLFGSRGTIKLNLGGDERLWIGKADERELQEVHLPESERGGWRVEAEFIGAIRGEETVRFTSFEAGLKYMQFTEAVAVSIREDRPVDLSELD